MQEQNKRVDGYIRKNNQWQAELEALRAIALACGLQEDLKWRAPCYTWENNNVVLFGAGKENCALSFMKGSLLKDAAGILEAPGPNSRVARTICFKDADEIHKLEATLKKYIREAIANEKAGVKVDLKDDALPPIPQELQEKFDEDAAFEKAFRALTSGRQRGYLLHFSSAKQSQTRTNRIEKYMPMIFEGKGMLDDYAKKKC